jgi:hypothetical protein
VHEVVGRLLVRFAEVFARNVEVVGA